MENLAKIEKITKKPIEEKVASDVISLMNDENRETFVTRLGLSTGKYIKNFENLDIVLNINDSKKAFDKAEKEFLRILKMYAEIEYIFSEVDVSDFWRQSGYAKLLLLLYNVEDINSKMKHEKRNYSDIKRNVDYIMKMVLQDNRYFVIRKRYGLDSGKIATLEEVGKEMSLTKERIKSIEKKSESILMKKNNLHFIKYGAYPGITVERPAVYVADLPLSNRAKNSLKKEGITKVDELLQLSDEIISSIDYLGKKGTEEVINLVKELKNARNY